MRLSTPLMQYVEPPLRLATNSGRHRPTIWGGGADPKTSGAAGRNVGTNCKPEGAGTTWKPADARRDATRDGWRHICVDRVLLAGSARSRNARGGAWVGPQLAVALSLLPLAVCRVWYE